MKLCLWLVLLLSVAFVNCSKKPPVPTAANSESASAPTSEPAAPAPAKMAPAAQAQTDVNEALVGWVDDFMTRQLRIFIQEKGRMPESFAEFASARMDSVPRPPKGLRFAIDATTQEVKLVKDK